jgi:hypothetical protein
MNTERQKNSERTWLPGISAEYLSAVVQSSPLGFIVFDVVGETVEALASAVESKDFYGEASTAGGLPSMCYRRRNGKNWR